MSAPARLQAPLSLLRAMNRRRADRQRPAWRRARGFTLVELMVAMAIGLVLALAVALTTLSMGSQFRTVSASTHAQVNAQLALSLIDDAGRMAGAGLFNNGQPMCLGFNAWVGGVVKSNGAPLLPARITDGGSATASDTLVFTFSAAPGALSGMPVVDAMASAGGNIVVGGGDSIAANDVALVGVPGSTTVPCTLFQVTAAPVASATCGGNATTCLPLQRTANVGVNAPTGTFSNEPRYGFATAGPVTGPAVVQRLGTSFRQTAFAVQCQSLVEYDAFSVAPSCTGSPLSFGAGTNALAMDIVLMQAQYGVSTNASSDVVANWVEPTGSWAAPSASDSRRIKAVRVVIVSRSKEGSLENLTAASCTNAGGVVNTGPCSFEDAEAPVIDLSGVAVPSGRTWRNYRYRVHQAVIPLRSVIWSD